MQEHANQYLERAIDYEAKAKQAATGPALTSGFSIGSATNVSNSQEWPERPLIAA